MTERMQRTELELAKERCLLVGAIIPGRYSPFEDPLAELDELVTTAGGQCVGRVTQKLDRPVGKTFLGKGKFEEIVDQVTELKADTVVVDDDLSPTQLSTIEEACRRKVIDRNEVILDIFASNAGSHQAKLQVELAQLQYELPRLARMWTHLERLGGGIGTRGPGESQIETDRRLIRRKITSLRKELDQIESRKVREVSTRRESFTASLVGYTNAGKSTLLNRLTNAGALVENRLFATLETLTRKVELDDGMSMLLSDTVGFIRRLPHHLVASFHATLEEAAQADLLLHVIDGSNPLAPQQIASVERTLSELGMADKERLYVFNKCDAVGDAPSLEGMLGRYEPSLPLSATTGEGVDALRQVLFEKARAGTTIATLRFPAADGRRFAMVNELGIVRDLRYEDVDVVVTAQLDHTSFERIKSLPGEVQVL